MRISDDVKIAIDACMGTYTFTAEDLVDPDATAAHIYAMWQEFVDDGEWHELGFSENDLANYIRWQAE